MQKIYLVIKEYYRDPYSNTVDHDPVEAFSTLGAAEDRAKELNSSSKQKKIYEVFYEVESVPFENC
jgi:hypothetical protein